MSNPLFTIAVAAHQTAPFLRKALDSVLAQSNNDYECIIVVEESTDNSLEIANEYATRDSRFKAVSLPKSGSPAGTRNYGIKHGIGQYLVALDGDDWLAPQHLASLAETIAAHPGLDAIHFTGQEVYEQDDGTFRNGEYLTNLTQNEDNLLMTGYEFTLKTGHKGTFKGYAWLTVCRIAFLREYALFQSDGLLMEDCEWSMRTQFLAKSIVFLNKPLYIYRRRSNSITTEAHNPRRFFDLITQFTFVQPFIDKYNVPLDVQRCWANKWLAIILPSFFHSAAERESTFAERIRARKILMTPPTLYTLRRFARLSSMPKRVGMELFFLSRYVGYWLPWLYFRLLYYPLALRRNK